MSVENNTDLWMQRALELAAQGQGSVEPNPMVGAVLVQGTEIVGEGYHQKFGGPHAELNAIRQAGEKSRGSTLFVTLEPCCHQGKTPPCTEAIIHAGIKQVVAAGPDPNPIVAGKGFDILRQAGIEVTTGFYRERAEALNAPYFKYIIEKVPYFIAKWAMTIDGKIASANGDSKWISNETSRSCVHHLRGRVDAVVVGINTVLKDDPLLTARPSGARKACRVVFDRQLQLPLYSKLVSTAQDFPVLVVHASQDVQKIKQLEQAGCECWELKSADRLKQVQLLALELGRRKVTNVLVEGGATLLGSFLDQKLIDEVWAFIAPKWLGSNLALGPVSGTGYELVSHAGRLRDVKVEILDQDVLIRGRCEYSPKSGTQ